MKVLLISASPINKTTSIGNTFLNIMPQEFELASIYTRAGVPDNRIKKAFTISEKRLMRFKKGVLVEKRYNEGVNGSSDGLETFARKHRFSVFFLLRELLWSVFGLKNKGIDEFVREFDPDIIFTVSTNQIHLNRIIEYVTEVSKKPLAVYAWDNNYFDNPYEKSFLKKKLHKREKLYMRRVINKAEKVFVISEKQKVDYDSEFGIDSAVLTKYESFDKPFEYRASSGVLKFVYTGNLGVGRWQTVAKLVSALCKINADGIKAQLDIYSSTPLTEEMKNSLAVKGTSEFKGSVSAEEVVAIQHSADVLVHAESFVKRDAHQVKYSFSTKIVDYLGCCKPILAIGPENIASVEYFAKNDSALVACSEKQLESCAELLVNNESIREEYARKAYDCGKRNHDEHAVKSKFVNCLKEV